MKKLLSFLIDLVTGNITWGIATVLTVSNLFFEAGYIEMSYSYLDWILALLSTGGLIVVGVAGEDLRQRLKKRFDV